MDLDGYPGLLLREEPNGVLLITINRPESYNSIDEELHDILAEIWSEIDTEPSFRATVVTGAGKAFSAGGNLKRDQENLGNYKNVGRVHQQARDLVLNIVNSEKPIISAINGPAVGAGLAIALLSDISLIGDQTRFTDGHSRVGLAAGDHSMIIWPLLCGMAKAKYYLMTADFIDGPEAERIGLVSKCVPQDDLLAEALAVAQTLATGPQNAIKATKRSLNHWLRSAQPIFEYSLAMEMLDLYGTDAQEGFGAMLQKRPPKFG